jgi:hypothetical protein
VVVRHSGLSANAHRGKVRKSAAVPLALRMVEQEVLMAAETSAESLSIFTHRAFHGALTSASPVIYHLLG